MNAWLSDGCNEITGQQLVYNIRTQSVRRPDDARRHAVGDGRIAHHDPAGGQARQTRARKRAPETKP